VRARRRSLLVCLLPLALGLSACGHKESHPTVADNEGFYVDAGPITYQVQLSRELNAYDVEDKEYLAGLPSTVPQPSRDEEWFAIFLWAKNQTHSAQTTTDSFDIVDTQGNKYYPVALNAAVNPFAWTSQTLEPDGTEPGPNSPASFGPTQGGELLFKINDDAYANRPMTLEINAPGQPPSTVSLDL
jgi:hypothetical protein